MLKRKPTQGFTVVPVIIALLVIAAIGFGGWYVWQSRQEKQPNKNTSANNPKTDVEPESSKDTQPIEDSKYLIIDEWDLRITLPDNLRGDISYFMNDRAERDFGGPVLVDFISKKFSAGSLKCGVVEELPRSLVSINRYTEGDGGEPLESQPFKSLGDSRYYFVKTGCEEAIEREGSTQDKQLLANLKKTIEDTLEKY